MNSWINQNQNSQFNPYTGSNMPYNLNTYYNGRAPVYKADPIHGENAAWQFPIGGGEIYLPDADEDIIWWIRIDQNGNKQVTPFDISLHEKPQPVDMNTILERLSALEEKVNAKSNKSNAKRNNEPATVVAAAATD